MNIRKKNKGIKMEEERLINFLSYYIMLFDKISTIFSYARFLSFYLKN